MIDDILAGLPWGLLLAFSIGPGFFVLLETSITKGFRAALTFDLGIVFSDIVFILIAYYSTNQLLEQLKDNPTLFLVGGLIMVSYGLISFIVLKKNFKKQELTDSDTLLISKNNYLALFFKGFLLNFINIGILGFWMMIIISFGPQLEMDTQRIFTFFASILAFYLMFDIIKIILAKQLKSKLNPSNIYKIKRVISFVILIFGVFFVLQGLFQKELHQVKEKIEKIKE
jgi:threonine/homoserine/homoserine lactone efflux protein